MSNGVTGQLVAVPIGAVMAYAGEVKDSGGVVEVCPGWLLCNGAAVSDRRFPELFQAIQASHGNGSDSMGPLPGASFNLPDYRGLFLRGVTGVSDRDPDCSDADRLQNHPGGNIGNRVGSYQSDGFGQHEHDIKDDGHTHGYNWLQHTGGPDIQGGAHCNRSDNNPFRTSNEKSNVHLVPEGGKETRPKNAYVHYIIRAK